MHMPRVINQLRKRIDRAAAIAIRGNPRVENGSNNADGSFFTIDRKRGIAAKFWIDARERLHTAEILMSEIFVINCINTYNKYAL